MGVTSIILKTAMRLVLPLSLMVAFYMYVKGHNAPGGGFIGGLVASVACAMFRISHGPEALLRMLPIHPRWLVSGGLGLALLTGVIPLLAGMPLLRSSVGTIALPWNETAHYASAVAFDTGVLLVVVGVSVGMIMRLSEELER